MKRVVIATIFFTGFVSLSFLWGQSPHRMSGERLTPKQIATQKADCLEKELFLSEKQHRKVYDIYLKQAKKAKNELSSPDGLIGGRLLFEGPHSGGRGWGFGERGGRNFQHDGSSFEKKCNLRPVVYPESEKERTAREKKMKKILSEGQYQRWMEIEERRRQNERDMQKREQLKRTFPELGLDQLEEEQQKDFINE